MQNLLEPHHVFAKKTNVEYAMVTPIDYVFVAVGVSLAAASVYRLLRHDNFGAPGVSLLFIGFLFAFVPYAKTLKLAGLGFSLDVEALERDVGAANATAAAAVNTAVNNKEALDDAIVAMRNLLQAFANTNGAAQSNADSHIERSREAIREAEVRLDRKSHAKSLYFKGTDGVQARNVSATEGWIILPESIKLRKVAGESSGVAVLSKKSATTFTVEVPLRSTRNIFERRPGWAEVIVEWVEVPVSGLVNESAKQ